MSFIPFFLCTIVMLVHTFSFGCTDMLLSFADDENFNFPWSSHNDNMCPPFDSVVIEVFIMVLRYILQKMHGFTIRIIAALGKRTNKFTVLQNKIKINYQ